MQLIITLRKDIEDPVEGKEIYELIKQRTQNWPDMTVTGHISNHFAEEPEVPPG